MLPQDPSQNHIIRAMSSLPDPRLSAAILAARSARLASRTLKTGGGSTVPGVVARRVDPKVLTKLSRRLPLGSAAITGTNGKTTTTRMVSKILADRRHSRRQQLDGGEPGYRRDGGPGLGLGPGRERLLGDGALRGGRGERPEGGRGGRAPDPRRPEPVPRPARPLRGACLHGQGHSLGLRGPATRAARWS